MDEVKIQVMVDHYQKTYELTYDIWQQRNRLFLYFVITVGLSTLLTFNIPQANFILIAFLAKQLGITEPIQVRELYNTFPYGILLMILMLIVFYLMVNLFHRVVYVLRNYQYLACLEKEIRHYLSFSKNSLYFTRESTFYENNRNVFINSVKWVYIIFLGILLLTFISHRVYSEFVAKNYLVVSVEIFISIIIIIYFIAYAYSSVKFDSNKNGN